MAFDPRLGGIVLFGGNSPEGVCNDTWEYDGQGWVEVATALPPTPRHGHGLVYHEARGRVLMFGGHSWTADLSETWEYDGSAWTLLPVVLPPASASFMALVYDSWRRTIVRYGGRFTYGETWQFRYESLQPIEVCRNGQDDDGDGDADCADWDCTLHPDCQ